MREGCVNDFFVFRVSPGRKWYSHLIKYIIHSTNELSNFIWRRSKVKCLKVFRYLRRYTDIWWDSGIHKPWKHWSYVFCTIEAVNRLLNRYSHTEYFYLINSGAIMTLSAFLLFKSKGICNGYNWANHQSAFSSA